MKKFSNSFKNILGALEAPITFSLVLAFFVEQFLNFLY